MEAQLLARKPLPAGAKINWSFNFKNRKWEPWICDRDCQDPARQASLLRNVKPSKSNTSDSNLKRFGRAAAFSFAWPVTVPLAFLSSCSGSTGDNNNPPIYDATVDASGIDPVDAGDASVIDDGGVPLANCINEGREGIEDSYLKLINPDNQGPCDALAMSYYGDAFTALCAHPNNRVLEFFASDTPELDMRHRVTDSAPAPDGGQAAVHPRGVLMFSPDGVTELAVVPYQQKNLAMPANVQGGLYVYNADSVDFQLTQDRDLAVRVVSGGDPDGTVFTFTDPVGTAFSQGKIWVAPENLDPATGGPIVSDIVGTPVVDRGNGLWILDDEVSLSSPDGMGYRPTAVAKINNTLMAGVFNGVAASSAADWEKPKLSIFDASSSEIFNDALLTIDNVGLTHDWEFAALPKVAKTSDGRNFVLAAENPTTGGQKILAVHVDDLGDVENSNHSVSSTPYVIPAELPNPAYRSGTEDPETISTGHVVSIVVHDSRAYVTTAGDGYNYGFMFALDINTSNAAVTPVGVKPLGINPGVATVDPVTGEIYQVVSQANCSAGDQAVPYVIRITPDEMTWDAI